MKIALLGYGKMGKEIERQALEKKHEVVLKVDVDNASAVSREDLQKAEAAIEFSTPSTAFGNIIRCFDAGIPVVVGTTGWLDKFGEVQRLCLEKQQALFYASNFSIGVNLYFELNRYLAGLINKQKGYTVSVDEVHHTQKLDAPSGTAITIANDLLHAIDGKSKWVCVEDGKKQKSVFPDELIINSHRIGNVPGTHTVTYDSPIDRIEIKHTAHGRQGFAAGALLAAEWIIGKKGVFGMKDLLNI